MSQVAPLAWGSFNAEGLREPRLRERLAVVLAREIVSGRLPVGAAFPSSDEVVHQFNVSRTVAREALQTLSMLGLVKVQHGKRTEVLPESEWDILSAVVQQALRAERRADAIVRSTYEFRILIEPQAAAWMAARASDDDIRALQELVRTMADAAPTSPAAALDADRTFHSLIANASGNAIYAAVARDIREVISTVWELSELGNEQATELARQHANIADAIAARQADAAAAAMREHLAWAVSQDVKATEERR